MVTEVRPWVRKLDANDAHKSFLVIFHSIDAAALLIRAAQDKTFKVNNKTPYASLLTSLKSSTNEKPGYLHSRVLVISGHPDAFTKISEEVIRDVLRSDTVAMAAAGQLGLESDPVTTVIYKEAGKEKMYSESVLKP